MLTLARSYGTFLPRVPKTKRTAKKRSLYNACEQPPSFTSFTPASFFRGPGCKHGRFYAVISRLRGRGRKLTLRPRDYLVEREQALVERPPPASSSNTVTLHTRPSHSRFPSGLGECRKQSRVRGCCVRRSRKYRKRERERLAAFRPLIAPRLVRDYARWMGPKRSGGSDSFAAFAPSLGEKGSEA